MLRKVDISIALICELCIKGNRILFVNGGEAECIEGIATDAQLLRAYIRPDGSVLSIILDDPNYIGNVDNAPLPLWERHYNKERP